MSKASEIIELLEKNINVKKVPSYNTMKRVVGIRIPTATDKEIIKGWSLLLAFNFANRKDLLKNDWFNIIGSSSASGRYPKHATFFTELLKNGWIYLQFKKEMDKRDLFDDNTVWIDKEIFKSK